MYIMEKKSKRGIVFPMKMKRSERLVDMTYQLLENPNRLISLTKFTERYNSAKSSISEDLGLVKKTLEMQQVGRIETVAGATGGVKYVPKMYTEEAIQFAGELCELIASPERMLPGGYVYLSDVLSNPVILKKLGRLIASKYEDKSIDAIITVATKGVPIAQTVANYLNVPFVIVRRDSKITEGSTVSVNYVSGSSTRVEKMELSKRSLSSGSNVLIVDDFFKAGGTISGLRSLVQEFDCTTAGAVVLCESGVSEHDIVDFESILYLYEIDSKESVIKAKPGSFFVE